MATLKSILALRDVIQALSAERGDDIGPCLLSDLKYDERAILGNPSTAFVWLVSSDGRSTHFMWADPYPPEWKYRTDDTRTLTGKRWIRVVCDAFRPTPFRFYFWNGTTLESHASEQALADRFEEYVQPLREASYG